MKWHANEHFLDLVSTYLQLQKAEENDKEKKCLNAFNKILCKEFGLINSIRGELKQFEEKDLTRLSIACQDHKVAESIIKSTLDNEIKFLECVKKLKSYFKSVIDNTNDDELNVLISSLDNLIDQSLALIANLEKTKSQASLEDQIILYQSAFSPIHIKDYLEIFVHLIPLYHSVIEKLDEGTKAKINSELSKILYPNQGMELEILKSLVNQRIATHISSLSRINSTLAMGKDLKSYKACQDKVSYLESYAKLIKLIQTPAPSPSVSSANGI